LLTGTLTGNWKWNECGDAPFGSRRSGMPLLKTPGSKPKGLRDKSKDFSCYSDKNE
jgi:hypothetical protein